MHRLVHVNVNTGPITNDIFLALVAGVGAGGDGGIAGATVNSANKGGDGTAAVAAAAGANVAGVRVVGGGVRVIVLRVNTVHGMASSSIHNKLCNIVLFTLL